VLEAAQEFHHGVLILGDRVDIIQPDDQWKLAAWAYKMALLLEIAMAPKERSPEFYAADERLQFHQTTLPDEHIRVFLANYKYGQRPTPARQYLHTLTRREDGVKFYPPNHDDYCWLPGHAGHRYFAVWTAAS
jgi:hypothetical protein